MAQNAAKYKVVQCYDGPDFEDESLGFVDSLEEAWALVRKQFDEGASECPGEVSPAADLPVYRWTHAGSDRCDASRLVRRAGPGYCDFSYLFELPPCEVSGDGSGTFYIGGGDIHYACYPVERGEEDEVAESAVSGA